MLIEKSLTVPADEAAGFLRGARVLIFDVDGTLAETEELHRQAFNDAFMDSGLDWHWDHALYSDLLRVAGGRERIRAYVDSLKAAPVFSDADIARLHGVKTARYVALIAAGCCPLRPGVAPLLAAAHEAGQLLAIATTTSRGNVDALLSPALGRDWAVRFDAIVAGEDVHHKKPAPDVFHEVLKRLDREPSDCVAIEDSAIGLTAAVRAGIPVLVTPSLFFVEDDFTAARFVLDNLSVLGPRPYAQVFTKVGRNLL